MTEFRVATWNMDNWKQTPKRRERAWAWLEETLAPDVALLQETIPPPDLDEVVWREEGIDENRAWASAIASFGTSIQEVRRARGRYHDEERSLHQTYPGTLAIARTHPDGAKPITVVSLYGLIDGGYATTTVHRLLTDLTPLIDSKAGDRMIIGGDLNCSTQFEPPYRKTHENLFDRFEANGLIDLARHTKDQRPPLEDCWCAKAPDCGHVQTLRHPSSDRPWNNDYLFASPTLANRLRSFDAVDDEDPGPWDFSDHCPLVATFDL